MKTVNNKNNTKPAPKKTAPKSETYPIPSYGDFEVAEKGKPTFDPAGSIATPTGVALWAWVGTKADTAFQKEPQQKITIVFDENEPEIEAFSQRLMAFENAYRDAIGKDNTTEVKILKEPNDKISEEYTKITGRTAGLYMLITRKARLDDEGNATPVPLFDEQANPMQGTIWGGDKVVVEFSLGAYTSPNKAIGTGIKPYLRAVQLIEEGPNREGGTGGGAGKAFKARGTTAKTAKPATEEDSVEESSDDIPF
jgi:hypothetical protein